jgi:hypothetical protein
MSEVNLKFEVHCQRPTWARFNVDCKYVDSKYRIYVNNDLIVERSWIWDNNIFLKEDVWVIADQEYMLELEPVVYIPEQAVFTLDNFQVANFQADSTKINDLQVNFILR